MTTRARSPYTNLARIRRTVQIAVLVFFLLLPLFYAMNLTDFHGSLYAMDFWGFLVIDPVIAIQKFIVGEGSWGLVLGAGIPIALALALGSVFCGWMCPFGFLSEMVSRLRLGRKLPGRLVHRPSRVRYLVLLSVFVVATLVHYPLATRLSMPGSLTLGISAWVTSGVVLLELWIALGVLAFSLVFPNLWCNHVCMQGAFLSLLRTPKTLRVHYDESRCGKRDCSEDCYESCPIGLDPRSMKTLSGCTNCGVCLAECSTDLGSLVYRFGKPRVE